MRKKNKKNKTKESTWTSKIYTDNKFGLLIGLRHMTDPPAEAMHGSGRA